MIDEGRATIFSSKLRFESLILLVCWVLKVMPFLSYFIEFIAINRAEFIVYRDKPKTREISLSIT